MEIKQRKFSNKTKFEFADKMLKYMIKDQGSTRLFSVEYSMIPTDYFEFEERNPYFRNVGIFWMALGGFFTVYPSIGGGSFWFGLGVLCMGIYWFLKTEYTVFESEKGQIFVIKDKKHDAILEEIDSRRKKQWLEFYGTLDYENDPAHEINKYKWLLEKEVISEQDCQDYIQKIEKHQKLTMSDGTIDNREETIN